MSTIIPNQDDVITHCSLAARLHAEGVARALEGFLTEPSERAVAILRAELAALASGWEPGAQNGGTWADRRREAKRALEAWDRVEPTHRLECFVRGSDSAGVLVFKAGPFFTRPSAEAACGRAIEQHRKAVSWDIVEAHVPVGGES